MRIILTSIFIFILFLAGFSKERPELFKGGMFLHAGYLTNKLDLPGIDGLCTGIGGKLTFRTGKHL
jgi:hypothetical protein